MTRPEPIVVPSSSFEVEADETERIDDPRDQEFGRYRLCYQLAAGGMATVFLARALGPEGVERPVAIKRIHSHLAKRRALVEMFLDEARIASRINHPNVCTVLDFGEQDGAYFLGMEYLLGEPLNAVASVVSQREDLLDSPTWRALAARIVADACEGLYAAHRLKDERGQPLEVVHRDVSLHNIFVTYAGTVKVLDFGIAKAATQVHRTNVGSIKGTYAYMAPEQFVGADVDCRADIWGLGVCLWELCTGKRLFSRNTQMETMLAVCSEPIPPPESVRPDVPAELSAVVMRALSRERANRFPSARAMSQALNEFLSHCPERTGMAELEEWMGALFGRERTTKLRMAESVVQRAPPVQPSIHERTTQLQSQFGSTQSEVRLTRAAPVRSPLASLAPVIAVAVGLVAVATLVVVMLLKSTDTAGSASVPVATNVNVLAPPPLPALAPTTATGSPQPLPLPQPVALPPTPLPPLPIADPVPIPAPLEQDPRRPAPGQRPHPSHQSPPPVPQSTAGEGYVNVSTPGGWAEIYEGSRLLGRSPRQFRLSAGRHVLAVRPFGRAPGWRRVVDIDADAVVRLSVPLSAQ